MKTYTDGFFSVNSSNGFLPLHEPLQTLPTKYSELQFLLDNMPICKEDGSSGYLSLNGGIEKATNQLPNFYQEVKEEKVISL